MLLSSFTCSFRNGNQFFKLNYKKIQIQVETISGKISAQHIKVPEHYEKLKTRLHERYNPLSTDVNKAPARA